MFRQELDIDLSDILRKLQMVLLPRKRVASDDIENDDADFWGPLFVVLFYSMISLYGQFTVSMPLSMAISPDNTDQPFVYNLNIRSLYTSTFTLADLIDNISNF